MGGMAGKRAGMAWWGKPGEAHRGGFWGRTQNLDGANPIALGAAAGFFPPRSFDPPSTKFMKIRLLTITIICAVAAVLGVQAQDSGKEPETELGKHMEKMSGAFRRLGRQVKDAAKNEDSLTQIAIIREHAEASTKLEPERKKLVPADKQEKFVTDYRAKMKSFLTDLGKLEAAIKAGNNVEAETLLATVKQDQKEGHTDFKKEKKKKG